VTVSTPFDVRPQLRRVESCRNYGVSPCVTAAPHYCAGAAVVSSARRRPEVWQSSRGHKILPI
jgi:hypothetical protein